MIETISTKPFLKMLIEVKYKLLEQDKRSKGFVKAIINARIQNLEEMINFLNQQTGDLDMEKLKIVLDNVPRPLSEIKPRQKDGGLAEVLVEEAKKLPPNSYVSLDVSKIKPQTFVTRVSVLKKNKVLPDDIYISRRGKDVLLVRKG